MQQTSAPAQSLIVRLLLAASDIYGMTITGFLVLWLFARYRWWQMMVAGFLLHWLLLPGFIILPLMLWQRRWRRSALAGVSVLAFTIFYGELFLPSLATPITCAADSMKCASRLVVMTYNVNAGASADDLLIDALRTSGADIIGLEEFGLDDAALIRDHLFDLYPYQIQQGDLIPGMGLISRYPITRYEFIMPPSQAFVIVDATIDVDGEPLHVIVMHPPPPGLKVPEYIVASRAILDVPVYIDRLMDGSPALLIGDLNAVDQSEEYALLVQAGLIDSWREAGWNFGLTFPAAQYKILPPFPLWRIDYIWHTHHFAAQRVWNGPLTGSDHRSVLADLLWKK